MSFSIYPDDDTATCKDFLSQHFHGLGNARIGWTDGNCVNVKMTAICIMKQIEETVHKKLVKLGNFAIIIRGRESFYSEKTKRFSENKRLEIVKKLIVLMCEEKDAPWTIPSFSRTLCVMRKFASGIESSDVPLTMELRVLISHSCKMEDSAVIHFDPDKIRFKKCFGFCHGDL